MPKIHPTEIPDIFTDGSGLFTVNSVPGEAVYGEKLVMQDGVEYRFWNARKSKLAALVLLGTQVFPFGEKTSVLYLGAASGTTASHLSDVCLHGMIYCVEIAPRPFRKLLSVSEARENMMPILADANNPDKYSGMVGTVDVLYQDIAQKNQAEVMLKNLSLVAKSGYALLMVKSRSIDVTRKPEEVYEDVKKELLDYGITVLETTILEPYERDHASFLTRK